MSNESGLSAHQQSQEVEYASPYHWTYTPLLEEGRDYFSYLRMAAERIPSDARSLVDIGCGDGRATAFLKDARPELSVTGLDYSERALALAAVMAVPRDILWSRVNLYDAPGSSSTTYDCATAIEVLEHFPTDRLDDAIRHIRGLLRVGGTFIITVPSVLASRPPKHYQHFTAASMAEHLVKNGFKVKSVAGQERASSWFYFAYKFADNRWWRCKPFMRWMNGKAYPRWVSPALLENANRLVFVAEAV